MAERRPNGIAACKAEENPNGIAACTAAEHVAEAAASGNAVREEKRQLTRNWSGYYLTIAYTIYQA